MNETQQLIDWRTAFPAMGECESAEWMNEAVEAMKQQQQEIATLRSRIDTAPVAIMDTRKALGLCAPTEDAFPALYALQGHKVALIDLGVVE